VRACVRASCPKVGVWSPAANRTTAWHHSSQASFLLASMVCWPVPRTKYNLIQSTRSEKSVRRNLDLDPPPLSCERTGRTALDCAAALCVLRSAFCVLRSALLQLHLHLHRTYIQALSSLVRLRPATSPQPVAARSAFFPLPQPPPHSFTKSLVWIFTSPAPEFHGSS
jgi:hypothetical protein